jgi:hypothetical protein
MVGYQHADATLAQLLQNALYVNDRDGVDAGERLVQQNESRFDTTVSFRKTDASCGK